MHLRKMNRRIIASVMFGLSLSVPNQNANCREFNSVHPNTPFIVSKGRFDKKIDTIFNLQGRPEISESLVALGENGDLQPFDRFVENLQRKSLLKFASYSINDSASGNDSTSGSSKSSTNSMPLAESNTPPKSSSELETPIPIVTQSDFLEDREILPHGPRQTLRKTTRLHFKRELDRRNSELQGKLIDYTNNHGANHRFFSEALQNERDMYVYLPPNYDPKLAYPLMIWLHGFTLDERSFFDLVPFLDQAMVAGKLPPMIVAAPDGSILGRVTTFNSGSFYLNTKAGRYEDYIQQDIWNLLHKQYLIRPEKNCHIMAGGSMGGYGAFNHAIKYRDRFGIVAGFIPPLNTRYEDCKGRYFGRFNPECVGMAERYRPNAPIAYFYGLIPIRQKRLIGPLYGKNSDVIGQLSKDNPIEMLDTFQVKPGQLEMFIGLARRDQFNLDAQADHFVYVARQRGLKVKVVEDPKGDHSTRTGIRFFPSFCEWIRPLIPPLSVPAAAKPATPPSISQTNSAELDSSVSPTKIQQSINPSIPKK